MSGHPTPPPDSDRAAEAGAPDVPGSPLQAVAIGLVIDIGGSSLLGIVLDSLYEWTLRGQDLSDAQVADAVAHLPLASPFGIAGLLLGALMSVLGGFVCARIVLRDEYRVGAVMAAVSLLLGMLFGAAADPDGLDGLLILCTVACNMLGVKYGAETNRRRQARTRATAGASTP